MKVSASRKTIIILSICLLLVLLGVVSLLYKDVISNGIKYGRWFSIDKYEELLDHCDWEREGKELKIKCKALLGSTKKEEGEVLCHNILLIGKEQGKDISKILICEKEDRVKLVDKRRDYKRLKAVNIEVLYLSKDILKHSFEEVTIKSMEELDILAMIEEDERVSELADYIDREYFNMDFYDNFYFQPDFLEDRYSLQRLIFLQGDVESIVVDNKDLIVRIATQVRRREITVQTKIKGFNFYNAQAKETHFITKDNLAEFSDSLVGKRVRPMFISSMRQRSELDKEVFFNTCNNKSSEEDKVIIRRFYTPICANWDLYNSLEERGKLSRDDYANFLLKQEDLNNININLISPLYSIILRDYEEQP